MKRAKTITGLLWQTLSVRWNSLSGRGRTFVIVGLVLAGAVALQVGTCAFGGCPGAASPCSTPCSASQATEDEPCPYAAQAAARAESGESQADDPPPCHAR
ncbi:MAG TPA: hypothetical protein ENK57_16225 [Polyangiaceae bacterium]|nr:hypothetical protein [Polyangiaceae bacterium]